MRVYAHADNTTHRSIMCLRRISLSSGTVRQLGCVKTRYNSAGVEVYTITPTNQYVSNDCAYQITMTLEEKVFVYGIKVVYA